MSKITKIVSVLAVMTAGCVSYHPPKVETPKIEAWKAAHTLSPISLQDKWWEVFNDPTLNSLEEEALQTSPNLQMAIARLNQAKALYMIARGDLFPHMDVRGSYTRERLSKNAIAASSSSQGGTASQQASSTSSTETPSLTNSASTDTSANNQTSTAIQATPANTAAALPKQHLTIIQMAPEISYEVDFWGKYLNATKAAVEVVKEEECAVQTAQLVLTSEVALRYFDVRAIDEQLLLVQKTIDSYNEEHALNLSRYTSGIDFEILPLQSESNYVNALAQQDALKNERVLAENLLAAAVGRTASSFTFEASKFEPLALDISAGVPAESLRKRPDVQEKEHFIEQRRHEVGVAKTAFYPSLTLFGFAGVQSSNMHSLFKWKNRVLAGSGQVFLPIFEGGKLTAELKRSKAAYDEAVSSFTDTFITACREVEDALSSIEHLDKQIAARKTDCALTNAEVGLYSRRYQQGITDYRAVLQSTRSSLQASQKLVQAQHDRVYQTVLLIKSIGGKST